METEGRKKLKFGDVSFQICQIFLRENWTKKFPTQYNIFIDD